MFFKTVPRLVLALVIFGVLLATASQGASLLAAKKNPVKRAAKKAVAAREGISRKDLKVVSKTKGAYRLTGVKTHDLKMMHKNTGEIYGVTLDQDLQEVDAGALLAAEEAAYRERYGKLEPELAELVANGGAANGVEVIVWLKMDEPAGPGRPAAAEQEPQLAAQDVEALYSQVDSALSATVSTAVNPVADRLRALGVEVATDTHTPVLFASLNAETLANVPSWDEVIEVYLDRTNEPSLSVARSTINANVVNSRGITGAGARVAQIEVGGRVATGNPYLSGTTLNTSFICASNSSHSTGVAGIIRSTHGTDRGIAPGALLWAGGSCGGSSSELLNRSTAAADWGANALNLSWGSNIGLTPGANDRFYDSMVINRFRSVIKSAGNEAGTCNSRSGNVTSPGLAYNVIAVGNFDDKNSVGWSGDTMSSCSSWRDPSSVRNDREKPEVSAPGTNINSTTTASPWIGGIGSGTSFAAPMVTGASALLFQRNSGLGLWPEAVKAIFMVTAIHNIEGATRLSEFDGAGAIVVDRADDVARGVGGRWGGISYSCSTTSPLDVATMSLSAGTRTRVAIAWDNDPMYSSYASQPGADLDLSIISPSNAFVTSSASWDNTYELVEFTPPTTGTYKIRVNRFRCSFSPRWLGWAWRQGN